MVKVDLFYRIPCEVGNLKYSIRVVLDETFNMSTHMMTMFGADNPTPIPDPRGEEPAAAGGGGHLNSN
jgi:hypothetical protein